VVTTDHPDNHGKYLVADGVTGYLCGATVEGLADALQRALDRPADFEALRAHTQRFSWAPRAEQLRQIYFAQAGRPHVA
jgi:glycosyltransferase involved in cell wall biosynthesis